MYQKLTTSHDNAVNLPINQALLAVRMMGCGTACPISAEMSVDDQSTSLPANSNRPGLRAYLKRFATSVRSLNAWFEQEELNGNPAVLALQMVSITMLMGIAYISTIMVGVTMGVQP